MIDMVVILAKGASHKKRRRTKGRNVSLERLAAMAMRFDNSRRRLRLYV
jgi:hypothetical protein